jgi:hypothetical protein
LETVEYLLNKFELTRERRGENFLKKAWVAERGESLMRERMREDKKKV